jgi:hypothetical protein
VIPDGVVTVANSAFSLCSSLTNITLPSSVTSIGSYAFSQCSSLATITVDDLNPAYSSAAGVLFDRSQTKLIQYPGGKAGSYTIPSGVTNVVSCAFLDCTRLTSITIPGGIASIADDAFHGCRGLTSVTILDGVAGIGTGAFDACTSLTNVALPDSVTTIGDVAFSECLSLPGITLPDSVVSIGTYAFLSCTSLTSVTIPRGVISIGNYAFDNCTSLTELRADVLNPAYSSVGGVLFNKSGTLLVLYPVGKTGSYQVPNGLTTIGNRAFCDCTRLTSVIIPSSVTSIETYGFYGCASLTGLYFKGKAPSVDPTAFYAAEQAKAYYLAENFGWGSWLGDLPAVLWNPQVQARTATFGVRTNRFGFTITGTSGLVIVVEACTNLTNPTWSPVATNTLTDGSSYFSDPQWTNYPARLYRLRSP